MYQASFLYPIALILLVGIVVSFFVHRWKLPTAFFLLLTGILLSRLPLPEQFLLLPKSFVAGVSILALIMVVYDAFSRLRLHHHDSYHHISMQLTTIFFGFVLIFLSIVLLLAKLTDEPLFALLASIILAGISIPFFQIHSVRLRQFLVTESSLNAAIVIFFSSLLIEFIIFNQTNLLITSLFFHLAMFSLQILVGIGAGLLLGLVVFKIFRKLSKHVTPIALLVICLSAYVLAEALNGSGVFAIITLALLFGTLTIKHRQELEEFSRTFSEAIEILVLLLIGLIVSIPLNINFIVISILIFLAYLLMRSLAVSLALKHHFFSEREKLAVTLMAPKGLIVAVIALNALFVSESLLPVVQLAVAFLLYSQFISWIFKGKA